MIPLKPVGEKTMRYASAKKGYKVTNSRITLNFKSKTLGIIREILKILKIRDSKIIYRKYSQKTTQLHSQIKC